MRGALGFAILAVAVIGSPAAGQSTTVQLPPADQTMRSVPPAPPPERRSETPPPFPPMSRSAPHHHSSVAIHHRTERHRTEHHAASHHEPAQHSTVRHSSRHEAAAKKHPLTRREKKDERFCATLSHRKALHNSTCRRIEKQQHQAAKPHQLTKQEKKDERRCSSLSLRHVMRDSKCRKVAERQLETTRHRSAGHKSEHRHGTSYKTAKRLENTAAHSRKHRRR
jgi:hypothetical protein